MSDYFEKHGFSPARTPDGGTGNGPTVPGDLPVAPVGPTVTVAPAHTGAAGSLSERVRSLRLSDKQVDRARGARLPWLLCLVFAACTAYFGYVAYGPREQEVPQPTSTLPATTSAPAAVRNSGEVVLESKGYIIPAHQIQVSPKVGGMIVKLMIEEGLRVKKGQVLAKLETVDYQADYDRARGTVDAAWERFLELYVGNRPEEIQQARAELEESEAQRDQLYLDWKRNNRLQSGQALAPRDYEQAYSAFRAMDRRVERLRQGYKLMLEGPREERINAAWAELQQAEAEAAKAKWKLDNCTIQAPIDGTILTKKAEEGNIVNPLAFNISSSLCDMADLSDLEVDLTIQERDIAKVFKGQQCKLRTEAFPERTYEGFVSRLMPIADRAKGAVPVRVKVRVPKDEEGVYLKPDMGAIVSFMRKGEAS